jgi:hypothetical protein
METTNKKDSNLKKLEEIERFLLIESNINEENYHLWESILFFPYSVFVSVINDLMEGNLTLKDINPFTRDIEKDEYKFSNLRDINLLKLVKENPAIEISEESSLRETLLLKAIVNSSELTFNPVILPKDLETERENIRRKLEELTSVDIAEKKQDLIFSGRTDFLAVKPTLKKYFIDIALLEKGRDEILSQLKIEEKSFLRMRLNNIIKRLETLYSLLQQEDESIERKL